MSHLLSKAGHLCRCAVTIAVVTIYISHLRNRFAIFDYLYPSGFARDAGRWSSGSLNCRNNFCDSTFSRYQLPLILICRVNPYTSHPHLPPTAQRAYDLRSDVELSIEHICDDCYLNALVSWWGRKGRRKGIRKGIGRHYRMSRCWELEVHVGILMERLDYEAFPSLRLVARFGHVVFCKCA